MGCHTWFYRPMKEYEWEEMKRNAPNEIYELTGDTSENVKFGLYDKNLFDSLMKSYNENIPCVYGKYWWQLGYGGLNISEIYGETGLFVEAPEYHDTFRVYNYPRKVIYSRRGLRRWLRKRYFELTEEQLNKISEFFKNNPGGVICFG